MTIQGAIKQLQELEVPSFQEPAVKAIMETIAETYAEGYKAGQSEKYAWHDLRKDPNDLPPHNMDVLVCAENQSGKRAYFVMWLSDRDEWLFQNQKPLCKFIAWREIQPFEE